MSQPCQGVVALTVGHPVLRQSTYNPPLHALRPYFGSIVYCGNAEQRCDAAVITKLVARIRSERAEQQQKGRSRRRLVGLHRALCPGHGVWVSFVISNRERTADWHQNMQLASREAGSSSRGSGRDGGTRGGWIIQARQAGSNVVGQAGRHAGGRETAHRQTNTCRQCQ